LLNINYQHISISRHWSSTIWLPWEDELLSNYVKHNGKKWNVFVQHCLPTKTPKQCQMRWTDTLDPDKKRGPFNEVEKQILIEAVNQRGKGNWKVISQHHLPHRSPRRIANEWSRLSSTLQHKEWTQDEDNLILQGFKEFGRAWSKIATHYLPWRTNLQIFNRFQSRLNPAMKMDKWTEEELDLLLRRTIMYGQDWKKVAAGIEGRTEAQCRTLWQTELDPSLRKEPWSDQELRLFWMRLYEFNGSLIKASEGMRGRSRILCSRKFWEIVSNKEFNVLYGDKIRRDDPTQDKNAWRANVAKWVLEWLDMPLNGYKMSNKCNRTQPWEEDELKRLEALVNKQKMDQKTLCEKDWERIEKEFKGRDKDQCKYQYEEYILKRDIKRGTWTKEEDEILIKLVEEYGTDGWDSIINRQMLQRTKQQCSYRWHNHLKFRDNILKGTRLTDNEKRLIQEGVDMFGHNWKTIQMSYLPHRTPRQISNWWKSEEKRIEFSSLTGHIHKRCSWSEEEDDILRFAVSKYNGTQISWAKVAKLIEGRSANQCEDRWKCTLQPDIKKGKWTYEEEMQLIEIVQKYKSQKKTSLWQLVAKELATGRTDNSCRAKYGSMKRKGHRFI
ncbi:Homeodomain-like protein, partial [Cokeromyces recurvatus]|uniref:Homeodomain-like protein n=1 Tax=Cokeromyces recurvatus TaxID=90255 RepID=UPI00221F2891